MKIELQYFRENDKWYSYVNEKMIGKWYNLEECFTGLLKMYKRGEFDEL